MFNFNEDGKNFLNLNFVQTVELLSVLGIIAVLVIAGIAIYFAKRQVFKKFLTIALIVVLASSIVLILYNVIADFASDSEDYQQYQLYLAIGIFLAIVAIVIFVAVRGDKNKSDAKALAYGAVCLSLSFALSYVRLFRMPQGGSITLASVTLLALYSYMFGVKRGLLACLAYGILQSLQDPWVVHPIQYLLDYPLAYMMFGFVGIFRNIKVNFRVQVLLGFVVAVVLRFVCHFFSGALYFGGYGVEFGILNPWTWGAFYNIPVLIDGLIAVLIALAALSNKQVAQVVLNVENDKKVPQN